MAFPTNQEFQDYLANTSFSAGDITAAIAAETAAQRAVCRYPEDLADFTDDLAEALKRRVARNLALRAVPLAVLTSLGDDGGGSAYIPQRDPEVRRLEAPYRRLVVG